MFRDPLISLLDLEIPFANLLLFFFCISGDFNAEARPGTTVFQTAQPGLQTQRWLNPAHPKVRFAQHSVFEHLNAFRPAGGHRPSLLSASRPFSPISAGIWVFKAGS